MTKQIGVRACPKAIHIGTGYQHSGDDDSPYDIDGILYCGRCHHLCDKSGNCLYPIPSPAHQGFYEWEKNIVDKNKHSVYSRCPHSLGMGINFPLDTVCGNCGKDGCITYYDAETIDELLTAQRKADFEEGWLRASFYNECNREANRGAPLIEQEFSDYIKRNGGSDK